MDRTTAITKLRKLLGKTMGYRVDPAAPKQEKRDAAHAALGPSIENRKTLVEQKEKRAAAILAADAEYQRLKAEAKAASEKVEALSAVARGYKITVGTTNGLFFVVKAEGDSWEQVISKLTAKEAVV